MSSQTVFVPWDQTSVTVDVALLQNASGANPGNPIVGLTYQSVTCYYAYGTNTSTAVAMATQTANGAYSSGGFVARDATNMPGSYRFDMPNGIVPPSGELNLVFNGTGTTGGTALATHTLKVIPTRQMWLGKLVEGYATVGVAVTPEQAVFENIQRAVPTNRSISGTVETVLGVNGTSTAMTFTLNSNSNPTQVTRTT
jgi:hypothetical protein